MGGGSTLIDRCVVGVDVQSYSSLNTRRQRDAQRALPQLLADAAEAAGLDRTTWEPFHTGDGELAVLPADANLLAVVGKFVPSLHDLLRLRNEDHLPETKLRLRVAVHIDALTSSTPGHYAGPALVVLSRLLDSQAVREALAQAARAELALVLSAPVHDKVVASGLLTLQGQDFAQAEVDMPSKGFHQVAYVHVPGHDMRTFPTSQAEGPDVRTEATPIGTAPPEAVRGEVGSQVENGEESKAPDSRPVIQAGPSSIVVGGNWVQGGSANTGANEPERRDGRLRNGGGNR